MDISVLAALVVGLAIFLVGTNVAFLFHLGSGTVGWFKTKILAVTGLLTYVALSAGLGSPSAWRLWIGLLALVVDLGAIFRMWAAIERAYQSGETGLVPIIRRKEDR